MEFFYNIEWIQNSRAWMESFLDNHPWLLVVACILWALGWILYRFNIRRTWRGFANTHNLNLSGNSVFKTQEIWGVYKDHAVNIFLHFPYASVSSRNRAKRKITWTVFRAHLSDHLPTGLILYVARPRDAMGIDTGMLTIQVGHADFDEHFIMRSQDRDAVHRLFKHPEVPNALCDLADYNPTLRLEDNCIEITFTREIASLSFLQEALDNLIDCAMAIDTYAQKIQKMESVNRVASNSSTTSTLSSPTDSEVKNDAETRDQMW